MKRLRKKYVPKNPFHPDNEPEEYEEHKEKWGIRYFHCGEYGENFGRAHFHAILFNFDFGDKEHWKTENGNRYYISEDLEKIWKHGHCIIGDVTFESAAYVARYCTKKINGKQKELHYATELVDRYGEIYDREEWEHPEYRELLAEMVKKGEIKVIETREPEYATMSRRPGIGKRWYEKYKSDIYPHDYVVVNGVKTRPPKFYDGQLEKSHAELHKEIKINRAADANKRAEDNNGERLSVKEKVKLAQVSQLKERI